MTLVVACVVVSVVFFTPPSVWEGFRQKIIIAYWRTRRRAEFRQHHPEEIKRRRVA